MGEVRGWAGLDKGANVAVFASTAPAGTWARVFRRHDRVLLGMAPILRHGPNDSAVIVVPPSAPSDLVVDLVAEPAQPLRSPTHVAVAEAIRTGRLAASQSRRRLPWATASWRSCADAWEQAGDQQRANLARRFADGDDDRRTRTGPVLLADELS